MSEMENLRKSKMRETIKLRKSKLALDQIKSESDYGADYGE